MVTQKLDDAGVAATKLSGSTFGTADNVLATADYWHYRLDSGTLLGFASPALWGSEAVSVINNLIVPTANIAIRLKARGSADMQFRMHVAPTVTTSGTEVTATDFDQTTVEPAASATFYHTSVLSATGALLYDQYIPSGEGKFGGGVAAGGADWGLAAGTVYNIVLIGHAIGTFCLSGEYYTK